MSSETSREVGDRIRAVRLERSLSQEQLAHELSTRQATISNWEQGHTTPTLDHLYSLAAVLECDVHDFLPPNIPPTPPAITRAIDAQLPLGARFQGSLELFLKVAMISPAPAATMTSEQQNPIARASELLLQLGATGPPVDVVSIAQACGARVVGWRSMDDSLAGLLVKLEDGPLIAYNSGHPLGRQRFTIAHELGHLLLGHLETFHVDLSTQEVAGSRPGYDRAHEKTANTFAANLLMPEPWMRELPDPAEMEEVAQKFEVSTLALGYRMLALGMSPPTGP